MFYTILDSWNLMKTWYYLTHPGIARIGALAPDWTSSPTVRYVPLGTVECTIREERTSRSAI